MGISLPPIELVQVGNKYYVRDGHHRISVARRLGKIDVDAEVTAWDVSGPLPWEKQARIPVLSRKRFGTPAVA